MGLVTVAEAARRLDVSTRQVQHLVKSGELSQLARGVLDEISLERFEAVRQGSHNRAWSESTAWAAVSLLSGGRAEWLGDTQRSRLKSRIRRLTAVDLVERTRGRATVTRYRAHSSVRQSLRDGLICSAAASAQLGLTESNAIDGYLSGDTVEDLVRGIGLIRDDNGLVTLRATSFDLLTVRRLAGGVVLAALDHAESLDSRERRAGIEALTSVLTDFHD
jgi:hypothetical protein